MNIRKITRGEVYYIKSFPTVGHEQKSGRPAVIVSNNENNAHSGVFEICYLTLKDKKELPTHVFVDRGPCINSTILCEQITSVAIDKVGDYLCTLPDDIMEKVNEALVVSLTLPLSIPSNPDISDPKMAEYMTPISVKAEMVSLKTENARLLKELDLAMDANKTIKAKFIEADRKAEMYERMYNDLLDRLVGRGNK